VKRSTIKGFSDYASFTDLSKLSVNGQIRRISGADFGYFSLQEGGKSKRGCLNVKTVCSE